MTVQQSGNVTAGHLAKWVTDGVIADNGANPYSERVIASITNANLADSGDQPIVLPATLRAFALTRLLITNASLQPLVAVGGFYPAASKAGSPIVAASQVYSALTTALIRMDATLSAYALAQRFTRTQLADWAIYFSLTTPDSQPITADIYAIGIELS